MLGPAGGSTNDAPRGEAATGVSSTFQKLLINFTWWVNRKDARGKRLSGGFLAGQYRRVFFFASDRSRPLPQRGHLEQADGTGLDGVPRATMLAMAPGVGRAV